MEIDLLRDDDQLPTIERLPLSSSDREASLDLQTVFDSVIDRAGNDYSLKYDCPLAPCRESHGQMDS